MADKIIEIEIKTNVDTTQSVKNIADLKGAIANLESESSKMDLGSEAFEKSKEQIDELKKKLESLSKSQSKLDEEMNAKAEEHAAKRAERMEKIGNDLAKFAAGVTDAFAGAFIAFGAGEEDAKKFNETLQKGVGVAVGVKGAIEAVVAGVQLAGPAFEAFNAVMAANPIGAVVVAVAALTAGIYLLVKAINAEESESEKLTKQLDKQKAAAEALSKARQSEISVIESKIGLMKAQGKSDGEILKATVELYDAKKRALQQDLVQLELTANVTKAKLQEVLAEDSLTESYYKNMAAIQRKLGEEKAAAMFEKLATASKLERSKEVTDQLLKDLTAVKELKDKIAILEIQKDTEVATAVAKNAEDRKKALEDGAKKQAEYLASQQAAYKSLLTVVKETNNSIKEAEDAMAGEVKMKTSASLLDKINAMAAERAAKKKSLDDINQDLRDALAEQLKDEKYSLKEREALIRETNEKIKENNEAAFQKQMSDINNYTQAIGSALNSVMGVFQAISDLQKQEAEQASKERQEKLDANLSALSDAKDLELEKEGLTQDEKVRIQEKYAQQEYELKLQAYNQDTAVKKKAFEQDKKMKIAQTVISTITGAMGALTGMISSIPGPVGIILGALSAAAVVATGAIQINAINKQKFDAGTPPSPPKVSKPSTSGFGEGGGGAMEAPSLKKIGRTEKEIADEAGGSTKRTSANEPMRAYVVSQDVTTAQDKNAVIDRRSSFVIGWLIIGVSFLFQLW